MASFLDGAECGPVNPLKQVGNRIEVDRSLQQDRLVSTPNVAGSSRQGASGPAQRPRTQQPFDLSSLRAHLSPPTAQLPQGPVQHAPAHQGPSHHAQTSHRVPETQRGPSPWAQSFNTQWHDEYARQTPSPSLSQARSLPPQVAPWARGHAQVYPPQGQMHHLPPQFSSGMVSPPFVPMPPAYHPPPPNVLERNPLLPQDTYHSESQPQPQSQPAREQPMTAAKPLDADQEVLARTADSFLSSLKSEEGILRDNPKLAQSQFMKLVNGLSDRSVVAEDSPRSDWQDVGPGAKFVNRGGGGDWAADFVVGTSEQSAQSGQPAQSSQATASAATTSAPQDDAERFNIYRTFGHYTPLQTAPVNDLVDHSSTKHQVNWDKQFADQEAIVQGRSESTNRHSQHQRRKSVHFDEEEEVRPLGPGVPSSLNEAVSHHAATRGYTSAWEEDLDGDLDQIISDAQDTQDTLDTRTAQDMEDEFGTEAFMEYNGEYRVAANQRSVGVGQVEGWETMRTDWEQYVKDHVSEEASALRGMGLGDQVERYAFQTRNPYTAFDDGIDSPTVKGVLELEAEVQRNPENHEAWYTLGLKQQENEREDQAILALSKAVQLRPDWRPAYLALAVSHTNEGDLTAANAVMERWIDLGLQNASGQASAGVEGVRKGVERQVLVDRLIDMARMSPEEVEADVQIALGVLFNASEEYEKAQDCFESALSVREDDWLLHNRLGATLANSGRSREAIEHYHRALSLHPNFVRALYNLGISYLNTNQYDRAAQSILDALRLQHADATEGYGSMQMEGGRGGLKGVGSGSLWLSLRNACTHLGRPDLVAFATARDIAAFPLEITAAQSIRGNVI